MVCGGNWRLIVNTLCVYLNEAREEGVGQQQRPERYSTDLHSDQTVRPHGKSAAAAVTKAIVIISGYNERGYMLI